MQLRQASNDRRYVRTITRPVINSKLTNKWLQIETTAITIVLLYIFVVLAVSNKADNCNPSHYIQRYIDSSQSKPSIRRSIACRPTTPIALSIVRLDCSLCDVAVKTTFFHVVVSFAALCFAECVGSAFFI